MSEINQAEWAEEYTKITKNPPELGTVLRTLDGTPVRLTAELKKGLSPFIFGRAFVPDLFGEQLGWYLQSADNESYHGWKCVLLPRARGELIKKVGLGEMQENEEESIILVKSLKIIRYSHSGNSILCEVAEYLDEETTEVEVEKVEG
jgi:hypothetical protein